MRCPLLDRREHAREPLGIRSAGECLAGMRKRGDRRERVIQLVRDDANDLFPDRDFLRRHLARQLLEQQQPVRLAVQRERPIADVKDFSLGTFGHREKRIHPALDGIAHRLRRASEDLSEFQALDLPPGAEELPCGDVAEDDRVVRVSQHQCKRRRLHDGIEQELALIEVEPFAPQAVAERVVLVGQVADFVGSRCRHAHAEVAVLEARRCRRRRRGCCGSSD